MKLLRTAAFALLVPSLAFAQPSSLSVQDFIGIFQEKSLSMREARARNESAAAQFQLDSDLFQSTLTLTPAFNRTEKNYLSSNLHFKDSGTEISAQLVQSTPIGLQMTLKGTKSYANGGAITDFFLDHRYSAALSLPLNRNRFGAASRFKSESSAHALSASQVALSVRQLESCQEAVGLFTRGWAEQERVKLIMESLKEAERALKSAESSYRRKLSRRIDWLAAQSDFLRLKDLLAEAKAEWTGTLEQLRSYAGPRIELTDPSAFIARPVLLNPLRNPRVNSPILEAPRLELNSAESALEAARSLQRSGIDLFTEYSRTQGQVVTAVLSDYREDTVKAGIQITLPIVNRSMDATVAQAGAQHALAQARLQEAEREFHAQAGGIAELLQSMEQKLGNHAQKVALKRSQATEAFQLMEIGRMEFEDYLRFRDALLSEILGGLQLQLSLWNAKSAWAKVTDQRSFLCGAQ